MPEGFRLVPALQLDDSLHITRTLKASLRLYFSPSNPTYDERFVGRREDDVRQELKFTHRRIGDKVGARPLD